MYSCRATALAAAILLMTAAAHAQEPQHQHQPPPSSTPAPTPEQEPMRTPMQMPMQMDMGMEMTGPLGISMSRDASGTSWLPDQTPMYAIHRQSGDWNLMLHENVFVHYINERGTRGDGQFGGTNWVMGMAHRDVAGGPLTLRGMLSIEPLTVGKCGYPTLLATGETCNNEPLHDRQHPHDLFMELAAQYQREINAGLAYQLYGGLAGEPALGPVAFPHRVSALPNPLAPVTHHWLDSTHISFGVLSAGLYQKRWKVEGSLFNGREPDEHRYDLDLAPLDSFSGRLWFLPTERWALQFSAGHLDDAEETHEGGARQDVNRITASATYHRQSESSPFWASTFAWGQNREEGEGTNAFLGETSVALDDRNTVFGRGEVNEKAAHDLALAHDEEGILTVGKLQVGYARQLGPIGSFVPNVGASMSFSVVPERLVRYYGDRTSVGFALFLSVRPGEMMSGMGHHHSQ